jgi:hypothetical protein
MKYGIDVWMLLLAVFALVLAVLAHEYRRAPGRHEIIWITRDAGVEP